MRLPAAHRLRSRIAAVGLFWITAVFVALPAQALVCCICSPSGSSAGAACLTDPAMDCTDFGDKIDNPQLKGMTCEHVDEAKCKAASSDPNGLCPSDPIAATAYKGPAPKPSYVDFDPIIPTFTPQTHIPGLEFSKKLISHGDTFDVPFLAEYIQAVYKYLIGISLVAAAVMIVWGGFKYLLSGTITDVKVAKGIITDAVIGLFLLFGITTIVYTINPDLTNLYALNITNITPIEYTDVEAEPPPSEEGKPATAAPPGEPTFDYIKPKAICRGQECQQYCNGGNVKVGSLPTVPWIPTKDQLQPISFENGVERPLGKQNKKIVLYLRKEAADALQRAGKAAQEAPGGPYTLRIGETFRPLEGQMFGTCQVLNAGSTKKLAAPGASKHGTGIAVDLSLYDKNGNKLLQPEFPLSAQQTNTKEENSKLLDDIMSSAGWVRYCPESWHYEYGTPESGEMLAHCPWPPPPPK